MSQTVVSQRKGRPRWQRRKEARPAEIVAAALEVFVERGFAAAKLADVARRAGVTKGTLYLYFDSKEALFKAVVRETIVPVIAQGEALAQSFTGSARDLVERLVREYWRLVGETNLAGIPKLMMAEAAEVNLSPHRRRRYGALCASGARHCPWLLPFFASAYRRSNRLYCRAPQSSYSSSWSSTNPNLRSSRRFIRQSGARSLPKLTDWIKPQR